MRKSSKKFRVQKVSVSSRFQEEDEADIKTLLVMNHSGHAAKRNILLIQRKKMCAQESCEVVYGMELVLQEGE